jgi:hypothetical protein
VGDPHTAADLALLDAVVALTRRRISVPSATAYEQVHGRPPSGRERVELRLAVLRLERDGLVVSDRDLRLEATPDGEVAAELFRARRRADGGRAAS